MTPRTRTASAAAPSQRTLNSAIRSTALGPDELLDLDDDREAIGLLAFERLLPLPLRDRLAPTLLDGLANRIAGGFELPDERLVDLDVRLELGPRQAHRRERRRRLPPDPTSRRAPPRDAAAPSPASDPSALMRAAGASCDGCAASSVSRSFVRARRAATLFRPRWRDGGKRRRVLNALERRHGRIGVLALQRDVENLFGIGQSRERAQAGRPVLRVTAHRAERLRIVDEIDNRAAHQAGWCSRAPPRRPPSCGRA